MSDIEIALIVAGSVLAYLVGAGVMYAIAVARGWTYTSGGINGEGTLAVAIWPLVLPAWLAATATTKLLTRSKLPRAIVSRDRGGR